MFDNAPNDNAGIRDGLPIAKIKEGSVVANAAASADAALSETTAQIKPSISLRSARGVTQWGLVVACLYLLIMVAITCPLIAFANYPNWRFAEAAEVYLAWPYWVWLAVMVVCQAALLLLPVRVASRRPVTRRPLIYPIAITGLMMGILAVGAIYTLWELACLPNRDQVLEIFNWPTSLCILGIACTIWAAWAAIFFEVSRRRSAAGALAAQSCTLLGGSILEVLVAIPTHIAARNRGDCCAGAGSFVGLTFGMSVMLFAFGPAVFFLYLARWRRLRPRRVLDDVAEPDQGPADVLGAPGRLRGWGFVVIVAVLAVLIVVDLTWLGMQAMTSARMERQAQWLMEEEARRLRQPVMLQPAAFGHDNKVPPKQVILVKTLVPLFAGDDEKLPPPDLNKARIRQQVLTADAKIQVVVLVQQNVVRWNHLEGGIQRDPPQPNMAIHRPPLTHASLNGWIVGVQCADVSADGKTVVLGCATGEVQIWEPAKSQRWALPQILIQAKPVGAVAISPDGRLCAAASADGAVFTWDVASGAQTAMLGGNGPVVHVLAFSRDGKTLAMGGQDGTIKLWEVGTGKIPTKLEGNEFPVRCLAFSPDGRWLASGSAKFYSGQLVMKDGAFAVFKDRPVEQLALKGGAALWDTATGESMTLHPLRGAVTGIAFSPDGRKLAVASESIDSNFKPGHDIFVSPDASSKVSIWDVPKAELLRSHDVAQGLFFTPMGPNHNLAVGCVAFSADSQTVVWAKDDMNPQRGKASK